MNVKLYRTTSEDNALDKNLEQILDTDINLLSQSSMTSFDITLAHDLTDVNYMYVPAWGKYYFLKEPTVERNGMIRFSANVDVLSSYKNQIRQESGIILRQEYEGNLYLVDGEYPSENRNKIFFKEFPNGFDAGLSYYLTIGG